MRRVLTGSLMAILALMLLAVPARAYVSQAEAEQAAANGAAWFESTQNGQTGALASANGGVGGGDRFGEWSLTALAAGGINAADSRQLLTSPSAQDYYDGWWTVRGPGATSCPVGGDNPAVCEQQPDGLPTDSARTVLSAIAGGLQPSRISAGRDFVSRLAFWWSGDQVGYRDLLNDDIFAIIALKHSGAPVELLETLALKIREQQLSDGGWHWRAATSDKPIPASVASDTDMTAAAIGALCAAGGTPATDAQIQEGLALIESRQTGNGIDGGSAAAQGGFSTSASPTGTNTNTTAWVASAFNMCGIDPQGQRWTTGQGETPLDFLVEMQNGNGSFRYMPANPAGSANLMASYQAVSPLGGNDWSGDAPVRENAGEPTVKPAPYVAEGTVVPLTLVVDHGEGTDVADRSRMCRIEVPEGSTLDQVLAKAETASAPGDCVTGVSTSNDGGEIEVTGLNGGDDWTVEVNGENEAGSYSGELGLGDMVVLRHQGGQALSPPAVVPVPQIGGNGAGDPDPDPGTDPDPDPDPDPNPIATYAKARVLGKPALRGRNVRVRVLCPAASSPSGCAVTATFAARQPARKRFVAFAATAAEIPAGRSRVLSVKAGKGVRALLKRTARKGKKGRALIRVTAGTRSADGVVRYSRVRGLIRGR